MLNSLLIPRNVILEDLRLTCFSSSISRKIHVSRQETSRFERPQLYAINCKRQTMKVSNRDSLSIPLPSKSISVRHSFHLLMWLQRVEKKPGAVKVWSLTPVRCPPAKLTHSNVFIQHYCLSHILTMFRQSEMESGYQLNSFCKITLVHLTIIGK